MAATKTPPVMLTGNVALGKQIDGYHYAYSPDGALAIEVDVPCEGMVQISWQASEIGKTASLIATREVFEAAMRSYFAEFSAKKN